MQVEHSCAISTKCSNIPCLFTENNVCTENRIVHESMHIIFENEGKIKIQNYGLSWILQLDYYEDVVFQLLGMLCQHLVLCKSISFIYIFSIIK